MSKKAPPKRPETAKFVYLGKAVNGATPAGQLIVSNAYVRSMGEIKGFTIVPGSKCTDLILNGIGCSIVEPSKQLVTFLKERTPEIPEDPIIVPVTPRLLGPDGKPH